MTTILKFKKFDIKSIEHGNNVAILGKRGVGKSTLIKDIMYNVRDIPQNGTVVSPTERITNFYSDIVPASVIHNEYTPEIIATYVENQMKMRTKSFMILDDCLYDNKWHDDKHLREILMYGHKLQTLSILSQQYPMGLPPTLRSNIDFTFIFRENIVSNRRKIYENYAGLFPSFDMFCCTLDQCTENFECLVVNNTSKSNKFEEQVFWYKAELHDDFKISLPAPAADVPMMQAQTPNSLKRKRDDNGDGVEMREEKRRHLAAAATEFV